MVPHSCPDPLHEQILEEVVEVEQLDGATCFSEDVWTSIPSAIIPCSIGGITVEAHVNPIMELNIMSWHLAYTLLGDVTLRPSDKLLKCCPFGHIIECRGVASVVLLTLDKIEVHLDFHIFDVLDFDLLIGYPLEISLTSHQGSLAGLLRETAFATATPCLENLLPKPLPEQNPLKKMMHTSPFISSEPVLLGVLESSEEYDPEDNLHFCEDERSSSSLIEFDPRPTSPHHIVLDHGRDTAMVVHDEPLEAENPWAREFNEALPLECEGSESIDEHGSFILESPPQSLLAALQS